MTPNAALDLATIGREWVFGGWYADEVEWYAAAYELAGRTEERG